MVYVHFLLGKTHDDVSYGRSCDRGYPSGTSSIGICRGLPSTPTGSRSRLNLLPTHRGKTDICGLLGGNLKEWRRDRRFLHISKTILDLSVGYSNYVFR
jgi:hypothetical protein